MNAVYLDNSSLELYHGLLDKRPGATTMRFKCAVVAITINVVAVLLPPLLSVYQLVSCFRYVFILCVVSAAAVWMVQQRVCIQTKLHLCVSEIGMPLAFSHACACCKFRPLGSVADHRWIGSKPGDNVMLERRLHDGNDAEVTALPLPERFVVPFLQDTLTQQEFVRNLKRIQVLPSAASNTLAVLHSLLLPSLLISSNGLFRMADPNPANPGVQH